MQFEPKYIIIDEKYTLSIINKNKPFDEKKAWGITIFKKNLELHILNEDNINIMLRNKKYIYSFANLGIILLSGIINFAFVTTQDVELAGSICLSKIYKIKNVNLIIIDDPEMKESTKNIIQEINKEFINSQIKNGLYFSENTLHLDLSYDDFYHHFNLNNPYYYHVNKSIGSCYNFDYLQYFNNSSLKDLTSSLISGFFYQKAIKNQKKREFKMNLIIRNKYLKEKEEENYNLDEIEVVLISSNLEKMFHFIFYIFYGDYLLNENIIHYILKENVPNGKKEKGSVIIFDIIDKISEKIDQEKDKYLEELKTKVVKNYNEDNHKFIFIKNKDKIIDEIGANKDILNAIKFNYEKNGEKKKYQEKQLLLISNKESDYFQIIENILLNLDYDILNNEEENLQKDIHSFIMEALTSFKNNINSKIVDCKKFYNIKPQPLNQDFINKYILAKNPGMKKNNIDKILSNGDNHIIIDKDEKEKENKKNELINTINKIKKEIFIYIVTYNVNNFNLGSNQNIDSLVNQLILPKELHKFFESNGYPLFYCIGLQEIVELNTSNIVLFSGKNNAKLWEIKISQILQKKYNYILQYKENLVGVLFLFFVKASEAKNITNTKKSIKKTGFLNQFGNKGTLFYEFIYKNKLFSICTGHLCAGNNTKKYNERVNELIDILNHTNDKNSIKFFKSDYFFIFGDLNFRVNNIDGKLFFAQVDEINSGLLLASDKKYKKIEIIKERSERVKSENRIINTNLLDEKDDNDKKDKNKKERKINEKLFQIYFSDEFYNNDELTNLKSVFEKYNIKESKVTFLPTYKYYKGINYYNVSTRLPAYTDRILFKNIKEIKCLIYNNIELNYSDHKPVYSLLQIEI